jgi:hypothetical protein
MYYELDCTVPKCRATFAFGSHRKDEDPAGKRIPNRAAGRSPSNLSPHRRRA